jgi:hypothetical protein
MITPHNSLPKLALTRRSCPFFIISLLLHCILRSYAHGFFTMQLVDPSYLETVLYLEESKKIKTWEAV